jgi:hypothetical protein
LFFKSHGVSRPYKPLKSVSVWDEIWDGIWDAIWDGTRHPIKIRIDTNHNNFRSDGWS